MCITFCGGFHAPNICILSCPESIAGKLRQCMYMDLKKHAPNIHAQKKSWTHSDSVCMWTKKQKQNNLLKHQHLYEPCSHKNENATYLQNTKPSISPQHKLGPLHITHQVHLRLFLWGLLRGHHCLQGGHHTADHRCCQRAGRCYRGV